MFSDIGPEQRVPADHSLLPIREMVPPAGRPTTTRVDASSSCPSREDAAACMVGRSTNRHSDITTDLKRPSFCGITRAVRLPRRT
jgi:hypothetical protein